MNRHGSLRQRQLPKWPKPPVKAARRLGVAQWLGKRVLASRAGPARAVARLVASDLHGRQSVPFKGNARARRRTSV